MAEIAAAVAEQVTAPKEAPPPAPPKTPKEIEISQRTRKLAETLVLLHEEIIQCTTLAPTHVGECEQMLRDALDHAKKAEAEDLRKRIKGLLNSLLDEGKRESRNSGRSSFSSEAGSRTDSPQPRRRLLSTSDTASMDSRNSTNSCSSVDMFQEDVDDSRRGSEEMADLLLKLCEEHAVNTKRADVEAARESLDEAINGPKPKKPKPKEQPVQSTPPAKRQSRASVGFTETPPSPPTVGREESGLTDAEGGSPDPRSPALRKKGKSLSNVMSSSRSSNTDSPGEDVGANAKSGSQGNLRKLLRPKSGSQLSKSKSFDTDGSPAVGRSESPPRSRRGVPSTGDKTRRSEDRRSSMSRGSFMNSLFHGMGFFQGTRERKRLAAAKQAEEEEEQLRIEEEEERAEAASGEGTSAQEKLSSGTGQLPAAQALPLADSPPQPSGTPEKLRCDTPDGTREPSRRSHREDDALLDEGSVLSNREAPPSARRNSLEGPSSARGGTKSERSVITPPSLAKKPSPISETVAKQASFDTSGVRQLA